jgi:hypothetical protein
MSSRTYHAPMGRVQTLLALPISAYVALRPAPPFEWPTAWRLSILGALVGSILAGFMVGAWWAAPLGWTGIGAGVSLGVTVGAPIGAAFGALAAPIIGLLLLRAVPLWLAVLGPALGTLVGGGVGILAPFWIAVAVRGPDPVRGAIGGMVVGSLGVRGLSRHLAARARRAAGIQAHTAP